MRPHDFRALAEAAKELSDAADVFLSMFDDRDTDAHQRAIDEARDNLLRVILKARLQALEEIGP
jgi:vacuolar-type H+-ATPase subunit E/Vma4